MSERMSKNERRKAGEKHRKGRSSRHTRGKGTGGRGRKR